MKALVSGQAAVGFLFDGERIASYGIDSGHYVAGKSALRLLAGTNDARTLECDSLESLETLVEQAWVADRTLRLLLLVLDRSEDRQVRVEAAECVEEFLSNLEAREFALNRLYSALLPAEADLRGALEISRGMPGVALLLSDLRDDQDIIASRIAAWAAIPMAMFETVSERENFRLDAIDSGAFRVFANASTADVALLEMLVHPNFRGRARARQWLQEWTRPLKGTLRGQHFEPVPRPPLKG